MGFRLISNLGAAIHPAQTSPPITRAPVGIPPTALSCITGPGSMPAPAPLATQPGPALGSAPITPSERMPARPQHSTLAPDRATELKQSPLPAHSHPLSQHSHRTACYKNSPDTARTSTESDQGSQHTRPASHPLQKHATAPAQCSCPRQSHKAQAESIARSVSPPIPAQPPHSLL